LSSCDDSTRTGSGTGGIPGTSSRNGIVISVRVEPRSSRSCVAGVRGDSLTVKVTAPPVGGEANRPLVELLSEHFEVPKSHVRILRGHRSRNKLVEIRAK